MNSRKLSKYDTAEKRKRDEQIRKLYRAGFGKAEIAARYGLSKNHIARICNDKDEDQAHDR